MNVSAHGSGENETSRDWPQLPARQVTLTVTGVMMALFLASLNQTVITTAMPDIVANLGGFDLYAWATAAYMATYATVMPIVGRLADLFGRKPFLVAGVALFVVGSGLAGFCQSMNQLIVCRALQGLGGGMIVVTSLVTVADLFPPEKRARYQSLAALVFGLSAVVGPVLGGTIAEHLAWNWIFLVNLPLGLPILALIAWTFPKLPPAVADRKLDYAGMAALILATAPIVLALSSGGARYPWTSWQIVGLIGLGLAMSAVFLTVEFRSTSPIMPLGIYRHRVVAVAAPATLLASVGMYGSLLFVPLYFQAVQGVSATDSGIILIPMLLGFIIGSIASGRYLTKIGERYRIAAAVTTGLSTLGIYLFSTLDAETSFAWAIACTLIAGLGIGGAVATYHAAVQNGVPFNVVGVSTSALQFCRVMGGMLGVAVLGAAMAARFSSELAGSGVAELTDGWIDADNPQALFDPDALANLQAGSIANEADGALTAEQVMESLTSSLTAAIRSVFIIAAMLNAVAFGLSLLLRMPAGAAGRNAPADNA